MSINFRSAALVAALSFTLSACVIPVSGSHSGYEPAVIQTDTQTPVVVAVVHPKAEKAENDVYVCKIKPFTQEFRSEGTHRGKTKLAVQKQCLAKTSSMFCEEKDIVCTTYR